MLPKLIITTGCSFTDKWTEHAWHHQLQNFMKEHYPDVKFKHVGMGSQGQELIQKKATLAVMEELNDYEPNEIAVIAMWSGTERLSFYIDNKGYIDNIVDVWKTKEVSWGYQFYDLHSEAKEKLRVQINDSKFTEYNPHGGWYITSHRANDSNLTKEIILSTETIIGPATISLENIIFLENFCKVNNVQLYHTFYRSYVYEDIALNQDHLNLNYLFKQWNHDNILSTVGMYEYLRPARVDRSKLNNMFDIIYPWDKDELMKDDYAKWFGSDSMHPNGQGAEKWLKEVLIPELSKRNFFDE
jgi:hypothetical protein